MDKGLTVAKIYDYVTTKKLNKNEALELLNFFIENNDDIEVRSNSIIAFKLLELKSQEAFNVLEKCLFSDESKIIRNIAAKVLVHNFPSKSKKLLAWAREQDKELNFEIK
jgi:HEAT repeat protein